jgi:hypothetical protein
MITREDMEGYVVDRLGTKKTCPSVSYQKRWPKTCGRPIKVVHNGVGYCGIHDPEHQAKMQQRCDEKVGGAA